MSTEKVFIIALALIILTGITGAIVTDHVETMEHVKQGHCKVALTGGMREWRKCN